MTDGSEDGAADVSDGGAADAPDGGAAAVQDGSRMPPVTEAGPNGHATAASGGAELDAQVWATDGVKATDGVAAKLKRGRGRVSRRR